MMALFGFGKKKEVAAKPTCTCSCGCSAPQAPEVVSDGQSSYTIEVLGTGCSSCHTLLENTRTAVSHLGLDAQVVYVQDMAQIAGYGVMHLPALVINHQVVSTGKVLKPAQVEDLLRKQNG